MFINLLDFNGQQASVESSQLIKLRPALQNLGDPDSCVLVDYASGGLFALGDLATIHDLFAPSVRLAGLHAPEGTPVYLNADGIVGIEIDDRYAGACVAVVGPGFQNQLVPTRNKIPLSESVDEAREKLEQARAQNLGDV